MKYLIVSDIHGSLPALEQVLAFYREQQCGMLCILGDILNYGPRNGYLKDLTRKGSQNVSMRWPVRLSPSVETVIRRWTRCCWTFPSCPITPCWWIMENVSFSPTDISTMRTDCRREGSIVFFMVTPTGGNLNGLSIQRSAIPAPSLSRRTGTCQHSLFTVTVRYPFTGWTAAGSRNFLSDGECIITAYYNCSLL